jgi:hypothetical protein
MDTERIPNTTFRYGRDLVALFTIYPEAIEALSTSEMHKFWLRLRAMAAFFARISSEIRKR